MKKVSRLPEVLFFIGYGLIIFSDMYNCIPWLQSVLTIIDVVAVLALVASFTIGFWSGKIKMSMSAIVGMSIFSALVAVTAMSSDTRTLLKLPFLFLAFSNVKFCKTVDFDLKCRSILLLLIFVLSLAGLNGNTVLEYRGGLMRNSFGVGHPNSFAFELSVICADLFYLTCWGKETKRKKIVPIIVSLVFLVFNYFFVGSRTNIILTTMLLVVYVFKDKVRIRSGIVKFLLKNMFLICLLISFVGVLVFRLDLPISHMLNTALSRRLEYESFAFSRYGVALFGHSINITVDNAYLGMLLRYGIILTICVGLMYYLTISKLISGKQKLLLMFFVVFMLYGLSETPIYSPGKSPFVLLLTCAFIPIEKVLHNTSGGAKLKKREGK